MNLIKSDQWKVIEICASYRTVFPPQVLIGGNGVKVVALPLRVL